MRYLVSLLMLFSLTGVAEHPSGEPPSLAWDSLNWLEGCWKGDGLGGTISECWVASDDGHYTAVFQLESRGSLSFTEIVAVADFDGQPAMRVRHFHPDFKQWESDGGAWITFPLLSIGDDRILFEGLEYRLEDGELRIRLDMKRRDGSIDPQRFTLRRIHRYPAE